MGAGPAYRGPSDRSQYRMKIPKGLQPLIDDGIVDEVIRPLKSGKEAAVFLVVCAGEIRCAKVYKDAEQRGFHKLAEYQRSEEHTSELHSLMRISYAVYCLKQKNKKTTN